MLYASSAAETDLRTASQFVLDRFSLRLRMLSALKCLRVDVVKFSWLEMEICPVRSEIAVLKTSSLLRSLLRFVHTASIDDSDVGVILVAGRLMRHVMRSQKVIKKSSS